MANALVNGSSPGKKTKSKLSTIPPAGPKHEESANVKKAKNAGHSGMDEERAMRAASALRTLTEAHKISQDKKLMRDVKAHAAEHMRGIESALSGPVKRSAR